MTRKNAFLFVARCIGDSGIARVAPGVQWEQVVRIASEYWMTLALYRALRDKGTIDRLPADLVEYFESIHDANATRNREILAHTAELAYLLNKIGVEPILLKGVSHLASDLYSDPAIRFMTDIDILVPNERALDSWRYLIAAGYRARITNVETLGNSEWPALVRPERTGEVEIHRPMEWRNMLGASWLYADLQNIDAGGSRVRLLSPVNRFVFAIAHAYVHHRLTAEIPVRDLFDALMLLHKHEREISLDQVTVAFARSGQMEAFRVACMMLRRLFSLNLPSCIVPPRIEWLRWRLSLLKISKPEWGLVCDRFIVNALLVQTAFSRGTEGRRIRREFCSFSTLFRKLRTGVALRRSS